MKAKIGYVLNAQDKIWKPVKDEEMFLRLIGTMDVLKRITAIRNYRIDNPQVTDTQYKRAKQSLKRGLPAFVFMGMTPDGNEGARTPLVPTGLGMIDIDTEKTPSATIYEAFCGKYGQPGGNCRFDVLLAHATPSGTGLRLVMQLRAGESLVYIQSQLLTDGFDVDTACKDYTRLSYACCSTDVYYLNARLFDLPEVEGCTETNSAAAQRSSAAAEAAIEAAIATEVAAESAVRSRYPKDYNGIPYSAICEALVGLIAGGAPNHGNRNTTIYAMARHLRTICNNDARWIEAVLPNYGEDQVRVRATIASACKAPLTQGMSYQLKRAIYQCTETKIVEEESEKRGVMPVMPQLPKPLAMMLSRVPSYARASCSMGLFPALATLQSRIKGDYIDGKLMELGISHVQIGETASGKSFINDPVVHVLKPITARDEASRAALKSWREKVMAMGNSKDKPVKPNMPIQWFSSNITPAAFTEMQMNLEESGGLYGFSLHPELETIRNMSSGGNGSVRAVAQLIKNAYDNSNEGQDRSSAQSVSGKCPLRWNFLASTTPVQAHNFFTKDLLTDGTMNRLSFSYLLPCEEGVPVAGYYDEQYEEDIRPYLDNLLRVPAVTHEMDEVYEWHEVFDAKNDVTTRMRVLKDSEQPFVIKTPDGFYQVHCPEALALCKRLSNKYKELADDTESVAMENFSLRGTGKAYKRALLLYVANGYRWDATFDAWLEWSMDYDIWSVMQHFGESVENALTCERNTSCKVGVASTLSILPSEFNTSDFLAAQRKLGRKVNSRTAQQKISKWQTRGLIEKTEVGWKKVSK